MTEKMKNLVKEAIMKSACEGDSEALLIALNLETELHNNLTFEEMLSA